MVGGSSAGDLRGARESSSLDNSRAPKKRARWIKRGVDVCGASMGLVALSPILAGACIAVRLSMGAPVLFRQERTGLHGTPFNLIKPRTMRTARRDERPIHSDAARLTGVGRFLRKTSIDELPQLVNVLLGDMSLVGPRPHLAQYLSRYSAEQARRHEVVPGITGWAQVNGRNALSWEKKLALDVWYVDRWSLALDAKILALTVLRVLERDGVSHDGHATTTEFMGTEDQPRERADTPPKARAMNAVMSEPG